MPRSCPNRSRGSDRWVVWMAELGLKAVFCCLISWLKLEALSSRFGDKYLFITPICSGHLYVDVIQLQAQNSPNLPYKVLSLLMARRSILQQLISLGQPPQKGHLLCVGAFPLSLSLTVSPQPSGEREVKPKQRGESSPPKVVVPWKMEKLKFILKVCISLLPGLPSSYPTFL